MGQHVHEAGVHGQPLAPALLPVAHAEFQPGAEGIHGIAVALGQREHGLADDQRNVPFQADAQPVLLVRAQVAMFLEIDPNFVVAHLHGEGAHVVGPLVESAAAGQVKARVVPVTDEQTVLDGALVQRETHVGTAVVHGVNCVAVAHEHNRVAAPLHRLDARGRQLGQIGCIDKITFHHDAPPCVNPARDRSPRASPSYHVRRGAQPRGFRQVHLKLGARAR